MEVESLKYLVVLLAAGMFIVILNQNTGKKGFLILLCVLSVLFITTNIEEFTLQDDPKLLELRTAVEPIFSKDIKHEGVLEVINKRDVLNEISMFKGDKSYTINKERVFLCLTDKNGKYYEMNILLYVFLHELAHCLSTTIGHDKNFNNIFDALLKKAAELKIYDPSKPMDQDYCNHK